MRRHRTPKTGSKSNLDEEIRMLKVFVKIVPNEIFLLRSLNLALNIITLKNVTFPPILIYRFIGVKMVLELHQMQTIVLERAVVCSLRK